jgi:hypothetical protein
MRRPSPRSAARTQAAYYLCTAAFPFISRRRFEAVTGPKLEWWLVLTVASQVGVIGAALGLAAGRNPRAPEIRLLGAGAAAGLGAIDVVYVARRRISPAYLVDGAIQTGILAMWLSAA